MEIEMFSYFFVITKTLSWSNNKWKCVMMMMLYNSPMVSASGRINYIIGGGRGGSNKGVSFFPLFERSWF